MSVKTFKNMVELKGVTIDGVPFKSTPHTNTGSANQTTAIVPAKTTTTVTTTTSSTASKLSSKDVFDEKADVAATADEAFEITIKVMTDLEKILKERTGSGHYQYALNEAFKDCVKGLIDLGKICPNIKDNNMDKLKECHSNMRSY